MAKALTEEVLARVKAHLLIRKQALAQITLIEQLDALSRTDLLTGLSNRRDITEKLEYEKSRFNRSKKSFSIILGDVDHFKKINDTHGHLAGDAILIALSDILKMAKRKSDVVARWGGEEFLILLPETTLVGATAFAENTRAAIESANISYSKLSLKATMSFGVASVTNSKMKIDTVVRVADDRLYQAKENGRNRVISK